MLQYKKKLKSNARILRSNLTPAEMLLWSRIRRRQLCNIQFYRQKPIGHYIVDFYAPEANLVIEIDGGQHFETDHMERDRARDHYLAELNLKVLRFDNLQVLRQTNDVLEVIFDVINRSVLKKKEGVI